MPLKINSKIFFTDQDKATILIRFIVGYVFLMEGIQKFVYSDKLGVGRFTKIGIPIPEIMAPTVGCFEIICGLCFLIGLMVRVSAIPSLVIMVTAISTTKLAVLMQNGLLTFSHEARNDLLMIFCILFLLIKGAGAFSIDHRLARLES
jgi:putative oxidoreductase